MKYLHNLFFVFALITISDLYAQTYTMGSVPSIVTCNGTFYDSGGPNGNYASGESSVITIYAGMSNVPVYVQFQEFDIEYLYDSLYVFNGASAAAPLLGIYTGLQLLDSTIISSNQTNALTFVFKADVGIQSSGWKATIGCGTPPVAPNVCPVPVKFCMDTFYSIPGDIGQTAHNGPDYGCLNQRPNPFWFYLMIDTPGLMRINLNSDVNGDIDFVCWGPFDTTETCTQLTGNTIVDCSYSPNATERVDILNAEAGKIYILCITNYNNQPSMLQISTDPTSTATTNCVGQSLGGGNGCTLTTRGYKCAGDSTFSVTGLVIVENPPSAGTLTIETNQGTQTQVFSAPFADTISYNLIGIPSVYGSTLVNARFSDSTACVLGQFFFNSSITSLSLAGFVTTDYSDTTAGFAVVNAQAGTQPYTFAWSTGDTTVSASNLLPGIYYVTVTDADGCSVADSVEIGFDALELMVVLNETPASAATAHDGSIIATVMGGLPPYQYLWNTQATTAAIYNLGIGNYTVTVTDARNVQKTDSVSVSIGVGISEAKGGFAFSVTPNPATTQLRFEFTNAFNGEGFVYGTDGKLFDTFAINNQTETLNIAGLPSGVYIVHVKDNATNATSFTRVVKY